MAVMLSLLVPLSSAVHAPFACRSGRSCCTRRHAGCVAVVELARDGGRGHEHLSAWLEEGDVCVFQTGQWMVDSVVVGPGTPPRLLLARVDCLQINWTTDCEHGRVIATAINHLEGDLVRIDEIEEFSGVEFGPEQLVARVPAQWEDELSGQLLSPLPPTLPASLPESVPLPIETHTTIGV
jgi:hypothetical protein